MLGYVVVVVVVVWCCVVVVGVVVVVVVGVVVVGVVVVGVVVVVNNSNRNNDSFSSSSSLYSCHNTRLLMAEMPLRSKRRLRESSICGCRAGHISFNTNETRICHRARRKRFLCTIGQTDQKSSCKYWATRSSICSLARIAHSFACSALLALLARSAALICLLVRSLPSSWERGF